MTYKALMIDTETLSLSPDAVVLQVGLVKMELDAGELLLPPTNIFMSLDEQTALGRRADARTVQWWMSQDPAVAKSVFLTAESEKHVDRVSIANLRLRLRELIDDETTVWAWPSTFDIPLLVNMFGGEGGAPWRYNRVRDLKTLSEALDPDRQLVPPENTAAHNAAADAEWQMAYLLNLWRHRNKLRGG